MVSRNVILFLLAVLLVTSLIEALVIFAAVLRIDALSESTKFEERRAEAAELALDKLSEQCSKSTQ